MASKADFIPPSRAQRMIVEHYAGEPCECPEAAKVLDSEAGGAYFLSVACKPCRARKALEMVRKVAEEG